jgi:hypothetical protein
MTKQTEKRRVFKIGIAMAGAVSAGAYTAGVMDYLLETLGEWEKAKAKNRELGEDHPDYDYSIPMHDVVIEVMGGASAGGMTSAMTALSLFDDMQPVHDINAPRIKNKLFDCWVNLNDGQGKSTLEQMMESRDIREEMGVPSLLNSEPIDQIALRAAEMSGKPKELPPYISPNLEIILTICSLRGIPIDVNFFDNDKPKSVRRPAKPAHRMHLHKGVAHFKVNPGENKPEHVIGFNPDVEQDRMLLMECAKATGAFPVGLKSRLLKGTSLSYIKGMVKRMFKSKTSDFNPENIGIDINTDDDPFEFVAIDGGTVNNEPFGEIIDVLEERYEEGSAFAVLMIDPFPNFTQSKGRVSHPTKLIELIPSIIGAIRGQAMMKENDLIKGLSNDYSRRMIFPSRGGDPYPIACGSLDGFGGFFSKEFREHDFQLGRKNCQSFLRNYFVVPCKKAYDMEVFSDWEEGDEKYMRYYNPERDGYPIIPDIDFDRRNINASALGIPERKKISPKLVFDLEKSMVKRFTEVLINLYQSDYVRPTPEQLDLKEKVEDIMETHYRSSVFGKISSGMMTAFGKLFWKYYLSGVMAKIMAKEVIKAVLTDFEKRGLLSDDHKKKK